MSHIVISRRPYDGRYLFDFNENALTIREWGWIRRLTGYRPLTVREAFEEGDEELQACFGVIALVRNGKIQNDDVLRVYELLIDGAADTTIIFEFDDEPQPDTADGPLPESSNGNELSSGGESMTSSETSPNPPNESGASGSATSESHLTPWAS